MRPEAMARSAGVTSVHSTSLSLEATQVSLAHALEAREEAEKALAAAGLAKADLQARVSELQGAPEARAHASRARKLEEALPLEVSPVEAAEAEAE